VRHFDETAHYIVRAWRVFLKGRFHTSPIGAHHRHSLNNYPRIGFLLLYCSFS